MLETSVLTQTPRLSTRPVAVLEVVGEIDVSSADRLDAAVRDVKNLGSPFVVDLCAVTFIDSSGIRVLLRNHDEGGFVIARAVTGNVARVLQIVGLEKVLDIFDDRETALMALVD